MNAGTPAVCPTRFRIAIGLALSSIAIAVCSLTALVGSLALVVGSLALVVGSLTLAACSSDSDVARAKSDTSASSTAGSSAASTATPPADAEHAAAAAGPLTFTAQPGWVVEKPTSGMRKAQYKLPHAEKDTDDASLIVYFFGGQGGSVQDNIDRWTGQFEQPDGRPSSTLLKNSTRTVNDMRVHDVDLSGTYVAETSPGSGQRYHNENWRMLASIIEAKEGPYYAKLVGPSATVAHWEASFRNFVSEMKPGK
jgi:hypothetical protein